MSRTTNIDNKPMLGKIIATQLKKLNKTQRTLAREIETDYVYLYRIISGRSRPSLNMLKRISVALDMNVGDLVNALLKDEEAANSGL